MKSLKRLWCAFLCLSWICLSGVAASGQAPTCKPFSVNIAPDYQLGPNAFSYTTADFNNDGKLDIAVPNTDARTVSIISGDGYGGFGPPKTLATGDINPRIITSADLNNDGRKDIIVAPSSDNKLLIFLNSSNGFTFLPYIVVPQNEFPAFAEYQELRTGDFNGDGNADIVAVMYQQNKKLKFLLGNGAGGFFYAGDLPIQANGAKLAIGRINNDNRDDIAILVTQGGGSPYVGFIYGPTNGVFTVSDIFTPTIPMGPFALADVNHDLQLDMVMASGAALQVWLKSGSGFVQGQTISVDWPFPPVNVVADDFDQDGNVDVVAPLGQSNGTMAMLIHSREDGRFGVPTFWAIPTSTQLFAAKLDQDQFPDLVAIANSSSNNNQAAVLKNDGQGGFKAPRASLWGATYIDAADLNGDGLKDYVSAWMTDSFNVGDVVTAQNDGLGGLNLDTSVATPKGVNGMVTGDFNGDGAKDAVTVHNNNTQQIAVYIGNGTGALASPVLSSINVSFTGVIAGDFNEDGKDDIFVTDTSSRGWVLLSNGNGTFTTAPNFPVTLQGQQLKLLKGDFNEDGHLDLIVSNGAVKLWLGSGTGQFTLSSATIPALGSVAKGDLNGDGHLDLAGFSMGALAGVLGDGTGAFTQTFSTSTFIGTGAALVSGDFNGDGSDDAAFDVSNNNLGNFVIVPSTSAPGGWGTPSYFNVGPTTSSGFIAAAQNLFATDYNSDGKIDIGYMGTGRGVLYNTAGTEPCISIDDATVTEDDSGLTNASFTVRLSSPSSQTVRVNYTVAAGTATLGTDLQNTSGRLEIPAGQTSTTIDVSITGDVLDEFDETFTVNLASADNGWISRPTALGTIIDNDAPPTLTIGDVTRTEGSSSQFYSFPVTLSGPSGKPISFRAISADGTANTGSDYNSTNIVANIAVGATTTSVGATVLGDNMYELDEDFFINISEPGNVVVADGQGRGVINNDDSVPTLSVTGGFGVEGDSGIINSSVNLQLTNPTYLPVTVNVLTSDGTAIGGIDYVLSDTPVVVPPGQTSLQATVQLRGDTIKETAETFFANIYNVANANTGTTQATFTIIDDEPTFNDFDGDRRADISIYRPSVGEWWYRRSSTGVVRALQFGATTDLIVPEDFTGDNKTDIAFWRPSTGQWFILRSENSSYFAFPFGTEGDIPMPADYDGDGKADAAVFRPSTGVWYIQRSSDGQTSIGQFGAAGDLPVSADYDGDGKADVAIIRRNAGNMEWWIQRSTAGVFATVFGVTDDKAVPGDYTGDGKTDVAVWRPSNGNWFVLRSEDLSYFSFPFGQTGDVPVPGDYDNDGKTDTAVYRPSDTVWYLNRSTSGVQFIQFGLASDQPVPNSYVR